MKTRLKALLLIFILSFSSCMKDDLSDCYDADNLFLTFEYVNREGKEMVKDVLEKVDVIFFDEENNFYSWIEINTAQLCDDRTLVLQMAPGTYKLIAWGNILNERDKLDEMSFQTIETSSIVHSNNSSIDPLYYSPKLNESIAGYMDNSSFTITISEQTTLHHTVKFRGAHHKLNIYLRNFPEVGNDQYDQPQVTIHNLSAGYDFYLNRKRETKSLVQRTTPITIEEEIQGFTSFHIPHFESQDNVFLNISGLNDSYYDIKVTMEEIIDALGIELTNEYVEEYDVELMYIEGGSRVKISLPQWKNHPVNPGFS